MRIFFSFSFADTIAGWDVKDSTTVSDEFVPSELEAEPSIKGLRVGIPKVGVVKVIDHCEIAP